MVGPTAQLVALCCHFNARASGVAAHAFFPANSTCQFCEFVQFVREEARRSGKSSSWKLVAQTPDEWLLHEVKPGRTALIMRHRVGDPPFSDRMSAGFVGGGGRWLLAISTAGKKDLWEASWEVGNQKAMDRRIWRVRYGLIGEQIEYAIPKLRTVKSICLKLKQGLVEILAFADEHRIEGFAACFRKAIQCLSSDDPVLSASHKDLVPDGLLDQPAKRLLAACQSAWVFGGMGSWNDMGFDGDEQKRYDRLSDTLFTLLNEGICASVNSASVRGK